MKLTLELYDAKMKKLELGDIVRVYQLHGRLVFYCEVKYLEKEKAIAPFHTFAFSEVEKVDSVPPEAVRMDESRYQCWGMPDPLDEEAVQHYQDYLVEWRACEHLINAGMFRITCESIPAGAQLSLL